MRRIDPDAADETEEQLQDLIDSWLDAATTEGRLRYEKQTNAPAALLVEAGKVLTDDRIAPGTEDIPWPTLRSLRDVDAETGLYLMRSIGGRNRT